MPELRGWSAFENQTGDSLVITRRVFLSSVIYTMAQDGGDVTLYEGQDVSSGRKIAKIYGQGSITRQVSFNPALDLERGLYVDVGSNVTEVTVCYVLA